MIVLNRCLPHEDSMVPADGLVDQRHSCGSSSSEENGRDGNAKRVLPLLVQAWAIHQGGAEP